MILVIMAVVHDTLRRRAVAGDPVPWSRSQARRNAMITGSRADGRRSHAAGSRPQANEGAAGYPPDGPYKRT